MLSLTYGVPSVSFEAPGDLIPAKRLHLPMPPGATRYGQDGVTTHVYHTADPSTFLFVFFFLFLFTSLPPSLRLSLSLFNFSLTFSHF